MRKILLMLAMCSSVVWAAPWKDPYLAEVDKLDNATLMQRQVAGDMPATVQLAINFFDAKNTEQSFRLLSLAAQRDIPTAHYRRGLYLWYCPDNCRNRPQGLAALERAAALGHPVAHEALGDIYKNGAPEAPKDMEKAYAHYVAAARQGLSPAQLVVATWLCAGQGVAKNVAEGRAWVKRMQEEHHIEIDDEDVGCE